eukprot:Clim_evm22s221 gene=Clim_evmTU22s221
MWRELAILGGGALGTALIAQFALGINVAFTVAYTIFSGPAGYYIWMKMLEKSVDREATAFNYDDHDVVVVPYASDNYCYLLVDRATKQTIAVDPAEGQRIDQEIRNRGLSLSGIIATHHHWDHAGGNYYFKKNYPDVPIYSGRADRTAGMTHPLDHGQNLEVANFSLSIIQTPGHTHGHIVVLAKHAKENLFAHLLTGDCLFLYGAGAIFEGTPSQMARSMQLLKTLARTHVSGGAPSNDESALGNVLVWVGHEYTISNLQFAQEIDPQNDLLRSEYEMAVRLREQNRPTVPGTFLRQLQGNPFLRLYTSEIQETLGLPAGTADKDEARVMKELRARKDKFQPVPPV